MERESIDIDGRSYTRGWWAGKDGMNVGPTQEKNPKFMEGWNEGLDVRYVLSMIQKAKYEK
ncbi:MAG: hypothetical protein RLZZ283_405 [Candidatus Parcubacteria bacterium]|jgi:hypothetical protein